MFRILFSLMLAAGVLPAADQIHLAWVESPATTMTVVWHTAPGVRSVAAIRAAGSSAWQETGGRIRPSGAGGSLHEVTFRSLKPATRYEYRVRSEEGWSDTFSTRTAPPSGKASFDFVFVADTGMIGRQDGLTTGTKQVIDEVAKLDPLFVLAGGDFAYYNTDKRFGTLDQTIDAWFNQMKPVAVKAPMMPTYGNHEIYLREGYLYWADRFPTPEGYDNRRYYAFDVGDVRIVSILAAESEFGGIPRSALDWIDREMAAARKAGKRVLPFLHVAPFSDGSNHPSNEDIRRELGPIFERHGVQIVLTCHDQSYERTWPLRDVAKDIQRTATRGNCFGPEHGITYLKVSPGGKLSNINKSFATFKTNPPPVWTAFRDNTMHHFARVKVTPDALEVEIFGVKGDGSAPVIQDRVRHQNTRCEER